METTRDATSNETGRDHRPVIGPAFRVLALALIAAALSLQVRNQFGYGGSFWNCLEFLFELEFKLLVIWLLTLSRMDGIVLPMLVALGTGLYLGAFETNFELTLFSVVWNPTATSLLVFGAQFILVWLAGKIFRIRLVSHRPHDRPSQFSIIELMSLMVIVAAASIVNSIRLYLDPTDINEMEWDWVDVKVYAWIAAWTVLWVITFGAFATLDRRRFLAFAALLIVIGVLISPWLQIGFFMQLYDVGFFSQWNWNSRQLQYPSGAPFSYQLLLNATLIGWGLAWTLSPLIAVVMFRWCGFQFSRFDSFTKLRESSADQQDPARDPFE